jgi:hypothetical protein
VATHRQQEVIIIGQPIGPVPRTTRTAKYSSMTITAGGALGAQTSSWA